MFTTVRLKTLASRCPARAVIAQRGVYPSRAGQRASVSRAGQRAGQARPLCSPATSKGKSTLLEWCESNPIKFGVGVATVKTQAADLLTQKSLEGKSWAEIDWRRNGLFTVFGFAYQGCFQYYLYVTLFSRWFAGAARFVNQPLSVKLTDYAGQRDVLKQIAFDVLIHPIWCTSEPPSLGLHTWDDPQRTRRRFFPMYYTLKEALCGHPSLFDGESPAAIGKVALSKYAANNFDTRSEDGLLTDWIAFWKIWVRGPVGWGASPLPSLTQPASAFTPWPIGAGRCGGVRLMPDVGTAASEPRLLLRVHLRALLHARVVCREGLALRNRRARERRSQRAEPNPKGYVRWVDVAEYFVPHF